MVYISWKPWNNQYPKLYFRTSAIAYIDKNNVKDGLNHNIPNCMKEVTWLKLCLGTNGHRSAALEWLPFILPPVFVQAAVLRSW